MPVLLLRCWREFTIASLLAAIGLLWLAKAGAEHRLAAAQATIEQEREAVRSRTAIATAQDAAHAARVERDQIRISQETRNDYQKQLADLRRRHDALRLRADTAADRGGGRDAPVPGVPAPAQGVDGAAGEDGLPAEDALIASEQALRLEALQAWVRGQQAAAR